MDDLVITAHLKATRRVNVDLCLRNMAASFVAGFVIWLVLDRQTEVSTALCPVLAMLMPLFLSSYTASASTHTML